MGKKKHGKKKKAKNEKAVEHVEIHPVEPARASVKKVRVKVVVVGNRRVGKTSLLRRYTKNEFSENQPPSTQAGFSARRITKDGLAFILQIWDTAGEEEFRSCLPLYLRGAKVAIMVYDVTQQESFADLNYWLTEVRKSAGDSVHLVVAGNKADLEGSKTVKSESVQAFAELHGAIFLETSAKTGMNIDELFQKIVNVLIKDTLTETTAAVELTVPETVRLKRKSRDMTARMSKDMSARLSKDLSEDEKTHHHHHHCGC